MRGRRGRAAVQARLSGRVHRDQSRLGRKQRRSARQVSAAPRVSATMSFTNRISQMLHEEHRATVALIERLEQLLARQRGGSPPDTGERGVAQLLADLSTGGEAEGQRHFAFEGGPPFTYLEAIGDVAIAAPLTEEHNPMRPIGVRV